MIKTNKLVKLTLILSVALALIGVLMHYWHYAGNYWLHTGINMMTGGNLSDTTAVLTLSISCMMIPIILGAMILIAVPKYWTKKSFKVTATVVYLGIFVIMLLALILNWNSEYKMYLNIFGIYNLYIPALFPLTMIPAVYFIFRSTDEIPKCIQLILTLSCPACLGLLLFRIGCNVVLEMGALILALLIKLAIDKKSKAAKADLFLFITIMFFSGILVSIVYRETHDGANLLAYLLTSLTDRTTSVMNLSQAAELLKQSKLIGASDYVINTGTQTIPAYLFYAEKDLIYLPLCLILRFGKVAADILAFLCIGLAVCFFKMSYECSDDPYPKYLTFSVGIYLLSKMVIAFQACFLAPLQDAVLPFCGLSSSIAVDSVLCAFAIAAYLNRDRFVIQQRETDIITNFSHRMCTFFCMEENEENKEEIEKDKENKQDDSRKKPYQLVVEIQDVDEDLDEEIRSAMDTLDRIGISMDDVDIRISVNESEEDDKNGQNSSQSASCISAKLKSIAEITDELLEMIKKDKTVKKGD